MPYFIGEPHSLGAAQQRSRQHHDNYQADQEAALEQQFANDPDAFNALPGGFTGALNGLRQSLMQQRGQAAFNAPWDAWMQESSDAADGQMPAIRGLRSNIKGAR